MKTTTKKILRMIAIFAFFFGSNFAIAQTWSTSPTQTVCAGSSGEPYLINPPTTGSTYQWSLSGGGIINLGSTTDNITVDWGLVPGLYILTLIETDASGCQGLPVTVDVTVISNPTVVANSSPSSPLCEGDQLTLTGSGTAGATYTWDQGVIDNVSFIPSVGTVTYTVTADVNGCTSSDNITVTVNPAPITGPINHTP